MTIVRAVDCSQRPPASSWARLRDEQGVALAIVESADGALKANYLDTAADVHATQGLSLASYAWPPKSVNAALGLIEQGPPCRFLALDVEEYQDWDARVMRAHVDALEAAGLPKLIYTSPYEWDRVMANSMEFADCMVWLAIFKTFDGSWPDNLDGPTVGGMRVVGRQFAGTTALCGGSYDLSVFDGDWLASLGGGEMITEEDVRRIVDEGIKAQVLDPLADWQRRDDERHDGLRSLLRAHLANHDPASLPDHEHEPGKVIR